MDTVPSASKVWFCFSASDKSGKTFDFRWEQVPEYRLEELLDFMINYFVRHELSHVLAGIHNNPEAVREYRRILSNKLEKATHHYAICCADDGTNKIVGFSSVYLNRKGEINKDFQAQTAEVKNFYKIRNSWMSLYPVIPGIFDWFGVEEFMAGAGLAVHDDYKGLGLSYGGLLIREAICKANNVRLTGAWITSPALQHVANKAGWQTIYELSSEELSSVLGLKLPRGQVYSYKVKEFF